MDDPGRFRSADWRWLAVTCTMLSLITAGQGILLRTAQHEESPLVATMVTSLVGWWYWVAIAPMLAWWCRRHPFVPGRMARAIAAHAALAAAVVAVHLVVMTAVAKRLLEDPATARPWSEWLLGSLLARGTVELLTYGALIGAIVAVVHVRRARARELAGAELSGALSRAELHALRLQLQPHFLFNTLNTISALTEESPADARRATVALADLLRETLGGDGSHVVPLADELALVDRYLAIERLRFPDRLSVTVDVPESLYAWAVPSFLLQPLVENAIRHGIAPRPGGGRVIVRARGIADHLSLEVWNDGTLPRPAAARPGIGIASTEARLARLYGGRARLTLQEADGGVLMQVTLPEQPALD